MSNIFNFPETYSFQCNEDTTLRIFRYPNASKIEFSNIELYDLSMGKNNGPSRWQRDALPLSYARN